MINGVTDLFMMKADVLSDFEDLSIAKQYINDGFISSEYPLDSSDVGPIYEKIKAWSLEGRTIEDGIPEDLKNYINEIEEFVQVPIKAISIGPEREKMIYINK